jgi:hypothetical protein
VVSAHRRHSRLEKQPRICPRCLNRDTLDYIDSTAQAENGGPTTSRLKVCNACNYEIRESYPARNLLCFSTHGVTAAGKTHWALMLYDLIRNSNIPVASSIKRIPSREDLRFDELVHRVLRGSGGLEATVFGLPYPLTFQVSDSDRFGSSKTIVNLFDFAGEMCNFAFDHNEFRRRSLLGDGFILFLDPTQVSAQSGSSLEAQVQALTQFAEEMHAIRGVPRESTIAMPIAVCVSKMDLLLTKSPMGSQAFTPVELLRSSMTQKLDLSLIHQRSQLCSSMLPQMFPGWNIERALRENFGNRYMFFPMSAVGLEQEELGIEELSQRTIAPVGIIEPILWLLHMNGYCVLS